MGTTTHIVGPAVATVIGGSTEAFAMACKWLLLKVFDAAALLSKCRLCISQRLLCINKSILHFIDLCMQIADLSLYLLISINFNAVDESGSSALDCIPNVRMQ